MILINLLTTFYMSDLHIFQQKAKLFPDDAEITVELILKKLHEIVAGRGKKGTDRNEQVRNLIS